MASKEQNFKPAKHPIIQDPIEQLFNRRLQVRYQKRQMINARLSEFSSRLILVHGLILLLVSLILIGIQIGIFVHKTKLYYVASGFWMALVFILCTLSLVLMKRKRSYEYLMSTLGVHFLAILSTVGGIILNVFDMAFYNMKCMNACETFSTQYLNLIVIIFGAIGLISVCIFMASIEYYVLYESRKLNIFLANRN